MRISITNVSAVSLPGSHEALITLFDGTVFKNDKLEREFFALRARLEQAEALLEATVEAGRRLLRAVDTGRLSTMEMESDRFKDAITAVEQPRWICDKCGHTESFEAEVSCWKCGKDLGGEMIYHPAFLAAKEAS